jgi:hypothetical protein
MATDITRYDQKLQISGRIPTTQFSTGAVKLKEQQAAAMLETAQKMEIRSAENAYLRGQTAISQELSRIEQENQADPDTMKTSIQNFSDGFLEDVYDVEVKQRLELQLSEHGQAAIARATAKRNQIITEQGAYETYLAMDGLQTQTEQAAMDYFTGDPATQESAARRMQEIMLRGQTILSQTGPDGTPYVGAAQRASFMFGLRDGTYETMARAWINSQPNKLQAASEWLDGNVTIQLPDENGQLQTVNMRESMPSTARAKADNAVMGLLRDRISIENHAMAMEEKSYEKIADQAYAAVMTELQGDPSMVGPPDPGRFEKSLQFLDINKNVFIRGGKEKEYFALRKSLISGDPEVENGAIKQQILTDALQGRDPSIIGVNAMQQRQVSIETLTQAQNIYRQTQGPADNALTYYTNSFKTAFGGVNKVMEGLAAAELANGPILLQRQYNQFIEKEGRVPSIQEFEPYYRSTLQGVAARTGMDTLLDSAALAPSFIAPSMMAGPKTPETLGRLQQGVVNHFTIRYGTNPDEWPDDDQELIQAKEWLMLYDQEVKAEQQPKTGGIR